MVIFTLETRDCRTGPTRMVIFTLETGGLSNWSQEKHFFNRKNTLFAADEREKLHIYLRNRGIVELVPGKTLF